MYQSSFRAVLRTAFGLQVAYDWNWLLEVTVPSSYYGATCGLCGNFNQDPNDDLTLLDGSVVPSIISWAGSWKVYLLESSCSDSCEEHPLICSKEQWQQYEGNDHCGFLQAPKGPFQDCHSTVNPSDFINTCASDACRDGGTKTSLCQALEVYAATCKDHGITVHAWREPSGCGELCNCCGWGILEQGSRWICKWHH